ncbi:MAG TPA: alpha/beta fold hydrolase [Burkholderiales bacterium]|nr:alpha/beta fold hydrolase [Burkholderiales bacterium]
MAMRSHPWHRLLAVLPVLVSGCVLLDLGNVPQQQRKIDSACRIEGTVGTRGNPDHALVVVLARLTGPDPHSRSSWSLADHFVLERAGRWQFFTGDGTYGVVAFEDANADLRYEAGEPYRRIREGELVQCTAGKHVSGIDLVVSADDRPREEGDVIDVAALQARTAGDQVQVTLGEVTAVGEVTSMDDPRFTDEVAAIGLWRPFDFLFDYHPGIYLLKPYDPGKIPVVFVHGIAGNPANFRTMIERLDRRRFQPFLYFYPSGGRLDVIADHLTQTMMKLEARYGIRRFYVVAHSMGGLTARGFVLRHGALAERVDIPLFVTLSTPWNGHKAAAQGVELSPAVVRVWYDMAPGSAYLTSLYYADAEKRVPVRLGPATAHHLMFSFRSSGTLSIGEANDGTVTVSSQLRQEAQRDAVRLYGFDETHMGILESREAWSVLEGLLNDPAAR